MKKIKIYLDGPTNIEIKKYYKKSDGFTFNPSLFKKLGVKNYLAYTKKLLKLTKNKPISIEVFADNEQDCYNQALKIHKINKNIFVKIPITYTNGKSTKNLIKRLSNENIRLNITAIFSLDQIKDIHSSLSNKKHILSIFSGRIYDIGIDASLQFIRMSNYIRKKTKCASLWASCRMPYDLIAAKKSGADIITMPVSLFEKTKKFGTKPKLSSLETVKGFYIDAKKAKFKI